MTKRSGAQGKSRSSEILASRVEIGLAGEMPACNVTEGHGWSEIDPARRIVAPHDTGHVGTGCVQTGNRNACRVEHARGTLGLESREGPEAAKHHFHSKEGTVLQRRDAGVGLLSCVRLPT